MLLNPRMVPLEVGRIEVESRFLLKARRTGEKEGTAGMLWREHHHHHHHQHNKYLIDLDDLPREQAFSGTRGRVLRVRANPLRQHAEHHAVEELPLQPTPQPRQTACHHRKERVRVSERPEPGHRRRDSRNERGGINARRSLSGWGAGRGIPPPSGREASKSVQKHPLSAPAGAVLNRPSFKQGATLVKSVQGRHPVLPLARIRLVRSARDSVS